jgi:hypothetical protein
VKPISPHIFGATTGLKPTVPWEGRKRRKEEVEGRKEGKEGR